MLKLSAMCTGKQIIEHVEKLELDPDSRSTLMRYLYLDLDLDYLNISGQMFKAGFTRSNQ